MKELNYLSDEELMQLMESAEQNTLLQAPGYLKDAIVQKSVSRRPPRRHELLFFSAKIITAAAASIALLFIMPDERQAGDFTRQELLSRTEASDNAAEDSFFRKFNQRANQFCSMVYDGTNLIFQKEEPK